MRSYLVRGSRPPRRTLPAHLAGTQVGEARARAVLLAWLLLTTLAVAQEANQPAGQVPELPETSVTGRAFPSQPLGDDTVVTATRSETPRSEVASSVTVINREQIERRQQPAVLDVLRGTPGLDVVQSGGPGRVSSVFLRGANAAQTKVLIDGIPVNDPSNATRLFDFSTLAADNIDRIEVLRGPQSTLYGSDAIGGVINIITKRGEGPAKLRTGTMGGSFGTFQQTANLSGGSEQTYYSLSGFFHRTDGISSADERLGNPEEDGFRDTNLSGRFGWTPTELLNVDYVFRYIDANAKQDQFDFFLGRPIDDAPLYLGRNLGRTFLNRVQLQSLAWDGMVENKVGFALTNYARRDPSPFAFATNFDGQTRVVDWQTNLRLLEHNTFTAGAMYLQEDASQLSLLGLTSGKQYDKAAFVQDQFSVADIWFATVGARWDDWNTAGPAQTYRVTNLIKVLDRTSVHGTIGTGFRAPALAENLFQFGNPNLKPETSKGWDVGMQQQLTESLTVDVTYFRNDFQNLIVFSPTTFLVENIGVARSSGLEATAFWNCSDVTSLSFSYTLTDTINLDPNAGAFYQQPLLRRPRDKASLFVHRKLFDNRALLSAYLLYVGDRLDRGPTDPITFDAIPTVLPRYFTTNVAGRYDLNDWCQFFGRIDNLFNEHYEEVFGFGTPGISAFAGVNLVW